MIISEQCSTSLDSERKIIGKYDKTETVWAKSSALGEQKSCWFGLVSGAPFLLGQGGPLGERHAFGEHCCSGACFLRLLQQTLYNPILCWDSMFLNTKKY